jgi:hypothetical protein
MLVRVAWKNIDWTKTAEANCITIKNQENFCRVPLAQEAVMV